jgi:prepilin peptidase CpaA
MIAHVDWAFGPGLIAWPARAVFLVVLVAACISDLRDRRIPNKLVLVGLAMGLMWQSFGPAGTGLFDPARPGALGLGPALAGAAVAFAIFLILHLARAMGAGDVKLAAMLGAFFGLELLPQLVLSIFLVGGVLAGLRMLNSPRRRAVLTNLQLIFFERFAALGGGVGPRFDPSTDTADRLPYAFAISGGALLLAALCVSGAIS